MTNKPTWEEFERAFRMESVGEDNKLLAVPDYYVLNRVKDLLSEQKKEIIEKILTLKYSLQDYPYREVVDIEELDWLKQD